MAGLEGHDVMNEQPTFTRSPLACPDEMHTTGTQLPEGRRPIPLRTKTRVKIGRIIIDPPQYQPDTLVE